MSTRYETSAVPGYFLSSPLMTFFTLFAAVVIASSLLEFNELLFPPKVSSIGFWALLPVYVFAIDAWFGVISWSRNLPYKDTPIIRTLSFLLVLAWVVMLATMYMASGVPVSLLGYLWGIVIICAMGEIIAFVMARIRQAIFEPITVYAVGGLIALVAAIAYSVWFFAFYPIPTAISWVFVSIAFAALVGMRVWMKVTHLWRPEEK